MQQFEPIPEKEELIGKAIVNAAYKVHKALGPGLLEKVYEVCMAHELTKAGFKVERQVQVSIVYDVITFDDSFRIDLLVDDLVICELKAVDTVNPVWEAQLLSHLKLTDRRLGYLINFNVTLVKNGIKRRVI